MIICISLLKYWRFALTFGITISSRKGRKSFPSSSFLCLLVRLVVFDSVTHAGLVNQQHPTLTAYRPRRLRPPSSCSSFSSSAPRMLSYSSRADGAQTHRGSAHRGTRYLPYDLNETFSHNCSHRELCVLQQMLPSSFPTFSLSLLLFATTL